MPTLTYSPSFRPTTTRSKALPDARSIRISAQTCSAIVLALNAYQGAFTRTHLLRLRQHYHHVATSGELAPLVDAIEREGAVHVHFDAEPGEGKPRR